MVASQVTATTRSSVLAPAIMREAVAMVAPVPETAPEMAIETAGVMVVTERDDDH